VHHLQSGESVRLLGDIVMLTLVYNQGGAMGTNFGSSSYYLIISLVILPVLLFYMYRNRNDFSLLIPLAFISGGAIGNLIDRIKFGQVIDFLDVNFYVNRIWGDERWWTFNVADACISIAIVFLLYRTVLHPPAEKETASQSMSSDKSPEHQS
jgi:signal peptidase II